MWPPSQPDNDFTTGPRLPSERLHGVFFPANSSRGPPTSDSPPNQNTDISLQSQSVSVDVFSSPLMSQLRGPSLWATAETQSGKFRMELYSICYSRKFYVPSSICCNSLLPWQPGSVAALFQKPTLKEKNIFTLNEHIHQVFPLTLMWFLLFF